MEEILGPLVGMVALSIPIVAIWTSHKAKMRRMELESQERIALAQRIGPETNSAEKVVEHLRPILDQLAEENQRLLAQNNDLAQRLGELERLLPAPEVETRR